MPAADEAVVHGFSPDKTVRVRNMENTQPQKLATKQQSARTCKGLWAKPVVDSANH